MRYFCSSCVFAPIFRATRCVQAFVAFANHYFKCIGGTAGAAAAAAAVRQLGELRAGKLVPNWDIVRAAALPVREEGADPDAPGTVPDLVAWVLNYIAETAPELALLLCDVLSGRASTGDLERMHKVCLSPARRSARAHACVQCARRSPAVRGAGGARRIGACEEQATGGGSRGLRTHLRWQARLERAYALKFACATFVIVARQDFGRQHTKERFSMSKETQRRLVFVRQHVRLEQRGAVYGHQLPFLDWSYTRWLGRERKKSERALEKAHHALVQLELEAEVLAAEADAEEAEWRATERAAAMAEVDTWLNLSLVGDDDFDVPEVAGAPEGSVDDY